MKARLQLTSLWKKPHCFSYVNHVVVMLTSFYLHKKSSEVCSKAKSTPASLLFKGLVTKHRTVKWSILIRLFLFQFTNNKIHGISVSVSKRKQQACSTCYWVQNDSFWPVFGMNGHFGNGLVLKRFKITVCSVFWKSPKRTRPNEIAYMGRWRSATQNMKNSFNWITNAVLCLSIIFNFYLI